MTEHSFIVGDSGGTGAQWLIVKDNSIRSFETVGYNPYTHDIEDLRTDLKDKLEEDVPVSLPVFLYSAGVDTEDHKTHVKKALKDVLGNDLMVDNDLLGAARALCGKEAGNVCILGTGSNACFYNGESVDKVSASLGYVLGDEGSGAHLGKKLLKGVFRGHFSQDILEMFQEKYQLTSHEVIQRIYDQPKANHYLASFAPFIYELRSCDEIQTMVYQGFTDFYSAFFLKNENPESKFFFTGSIAFHFSDILRTVSADLGYEVQSILKSPIDQLVVYHQNYG